MFLARPLAFEHLAAPSGSGSVSGLRQLRHRFAVERQGGVSLQTIALQSGANKEALFVPVECLGTAAGWVGEVVQAGPRPGEVLTHSRRVSKGPPDTS